MALTRREFLTVPLCASLLVACSGGRGETLQVPPHYRLLKSGHSGTNARTVAVLMPETPQTREVWTGLSDELASEFDLVAVTFERGSERAAVAESIARYHPAGLVLMNNPTVAAYRDYQRNAPTLAFPPAVVVMTSFLEGQVGSLVAATGVSYEVPLITVMTNVRRLFKLTSERVGVVVRTPLRAFVGAQVELARSEQIVVVQELVSANPNPSELKRAIRRLKQHADILWILNDDRLLTPALISQGWLPGLEERPWVPSIVGARSLVSTERAFGTFAVLPDHVALGAQAAGLLLDIANNDWQLSPGVAIQQPLSTTTTLDLVQTRERFTMRPDALQQVDRVLEK